MIRTFQADAVNAIANDPRVRPSLGGDGALDLAPLVEDRRNITLQFDLGAFVFREIGGYGLIYELHSLFLPEGWGRPAAAAAREAALHMFAGVGAALLVTFEQAGAWRSRPPKSHGWKLARDAWVVMEGMPVCTWCLTAENWRQSAIMKGKH